MMLDVFHNKKPALQAFSLIELLVCLVLLSVLIVSVALPSLYAQRVEATVSQVHQVNRSLANLAAALSVINQSSERSAFLEKWQQDLKQAVPGVSIRLSDASEQSILVIIAWPLASGMIAVSAGSPRLNTLERTVYF